VIEAARRAAALLQNKLNTMQRLQCSFHIQQLRDYDTLQSRHHSPHHIPHPFLYHTLFRLDELFAIQQII